MHYGTTIAILIAWVSASAAAEISADDTPFPGDPKALIYGHAPLVHPIAPQAHISGRVLLLSARKSAFAESEWSAARKIQFKSESVPFTLPLSGVD
jgi:hypothetical protein